MFGDRILIMNVYNTIMVLTSSDFDIADNITYKNGILICWGELCFEILQREHGQTVYYKQRRGTYKGSWNRNVPNREFLFLGSHCMGWCCCGRSTQKKRRRHYYCSHEHSLWCHVRKKETMPIAYYGMEKKFID